MRKSRLLCSHTQIICKRQTSALVLPPQRLPILSCASTSPVMPCPARTANEDLYKPEIYPSLVPKVTHTGPPPVCLGLLNMDLNKTEEPVPGNGTATSTAEESNTAGSIQRTPDSLRLLEGRCERTLDSALLLDRKSGTEVTLLDGEIFTGTATTTATSSDSATISSKVKSKILPADLLSKVTSFIQKHKDDIDLDSQPVLETALPAKENYSELTQICEVEFMDDDLGSLLSFAGDEVNKPPKKEREKPRKQKGKTGKKRKQEDRAEGEDTAEGTTRKKPRPNYFVAIQVTNPQIKTRLEHVQKYITSQNPKLTAALVPTATVHLTLMVMHLDDKMESDDSDMSRAKAALNICGTKLQDVVERPVQLKVAGTSNFRNQVVFAEVLEGEALNRLTHIAEVVQKSFSEQQLHPADPRGFKPHITIMKLSKSPKLAKKVGKIAPHLYEPYCDAAYGKQTLLSLQLCSMMQKKDEAGYYHVVHSVPLVPSDYSVDDTPSSETEQPFDFNLPQPPGDSREPQVFTAEFEKTLEWKFTVDGGPSC